MIRFRKSTLVGIAVLILISVNMLCAMPPHPRLGKAGQTRYLTTRAHRAAARKKTVGDRAAAAFPSTGNRRAIVLLEQFPDLSFQSGDNVSYYSNLFMGSNSSQLCWHKFYMDMSGGKLNLNVSVYGPYTAVSNHNYYGSANNGNGYPGELVAEAVRAAVSNGVNLTQGDNLSNGNVNVIILVHAGMGGEFSGNASDIWSFESDLDSEAEGYSDGTGHLTFSNGETVNTFTMQPEGVEMSYPASSNMQASIGVYCHEFGHSMGLVDLYDTVDTSYPGVGVWSLMAAGVWNGPNEDGSVPAPLTAWERYWLGWVSLVTPGGIVYSTGIQGGQGSGNGVPPAKWIPLAAASLPAALFLFFAILSLIARRKLRWVLPAAASAAVLLVIPVFLTTLPACSFNMTFGSSSRSSSSSEKSGSSSKSSASSEKTESSVSSVSSVSSGLSTSSASSVPGVTLSVTNRLSTMTMWRIPSGDSSNLQYYVLENVARDAGTWNAYLPGDGLLITFIDETVLNDNWSANTVNSGVDNIHGITVVEADGQNTLWKGSDQGVAGDLFSSDDGYTAFGSGTTPQAVYYTPESATSLSGYTNAVFSLTGIGSPGEVMSLVYRTN
jgi:M6 family metalloprotease-like protein